MKKGFTLTELLVSIVIITMILMIALPAITNIIQKNNKDLCDSYKKMFIEYAMVSDKRETSTNINLTDIDGLDKVKKECTGYIEIDKSTNPYTYTPHLTCSKCSSE